MKKQRIAIIAVLITLIAVTLCSCGETKLSGTYVAENNKNIYFKFSGERNVSVYSESGHIDGVYTILDKAAVLYFDSEPEEFNTLVLDIKSNKKFYLLSTAFVKQGFLKRHWLKILIGLFIIGLLITIYEKITGRSFEDDMEKLADKIPD